MNNTKVFKLSSIVLILLLLTTIVVRIGYINFINYRDTIISQQQDHLLTIAKSATRSFELFLEERTHNLEVLAENIEQINGKLESPNGSINSEAKLKIKTFYKQYIKEIEIITMLDDKGHTLYEYPNNKILNKNIEVKQSNINYVLKNHKQHIGKVYKSDENEFSIDIIQPIYDNQTSYVLINTINLNTLYNNLIDPIRPGQRGYTMVKNADGIILMHPAKDQVGIKSLEIRKRLYPQYDWTELEELSKRQALEKEGVATYHSIWWQEESLNWVQKLSAFTSIDIGRDSWIIAVQMAYSEIEKPIKESFINILAIVLIVVLSLIIGSIKIMNVEKNKKALEIETKYLKELNKTSEELRKSEKKLRHSQKLQTIGTLTGGIAHEFNNLLTPILGYSEIILKNISKKNDIYEDILEINKASKKAKKIIEQILVFSRNGDTSFEISPVEISTLINETIKLIESIVPKNIKLIKKIQVNLGYVLADDTQLYEIILNLCTNAYQAMKDNGGILEIRLDSIHIDDKKASDLNITQGKYVRITVEDTGCGIDEEILDRVFDPFFTTKQVGEGTGLGLSVVQGIIARHKGSIQIESQSGIGTKVYVYLPLINSRQLNNIKYKDREYEKYQGEILIIDDDIKVLKVLEKGLKFFGYNVKAESNGLDTLSFIEKKNPKFDLVIIDYTMPKINGLDIAKKIKKIDNNIKIILVSGFIEDKNILSHHRSVIDDYMIKPIIIDELVEKIKELTK